MRGGNVGAAVARALDLSEYRFLSLRVVLNNAVASDRKCFRGELVDSAWPGRSIEPPLPRCGWNRRRTGQGYPRLVATSS